MRRTAGGAVLLTPRIQPPGALVWRDSDALSVRPPPHHTEQDAVSEAYDRTLALLHAWVVRTGIKAGMMALPTREHFLASIGETGARVGSGGMGHRHRMLPHAAAGRVQEGGGRLRAAARAAAAALRAPAHAPHPHLAPCRLRAAPHAEESAREHAEGFVGAAHKLVGLVEALYGGIEMPRSDFSVSSLWK